MLAKKSCLLTGGINIVGIASSVFLISSLLCSNIDISTYVAYGQSSLPMVPSVKIVSPESGQQVPISISNATRGTNANVNNSLSISGTASDDADSPCEVSVLLNDVRPYQRATPQGNSGKSDYSNWQFILKPDYAPIKQGENKITAKLECLRSPANLTKWYSVSVTGVTREQLLLQEQQIQKQELEQKRQEQQALREIQLKRQTEQQMIERAKANAAKINQTAMFVTIESHEKDQYAPIGPLTISGTSSDDIETDCEVYIDWNDLKPFQKAKPKSLISGGNGPQTQSVRNDYSNWTFTFSKEYHEIVQGTNELTAKLDCLAYPNNYTKFSSVNITGAPQELILQQQQEAQLQQQQMIERAKANAAKINQTAMFVTIESPAENQSVPTDSSLTISGTSSDNVTTDCDVSVVLNSKTPYQRALPMNSSDSVDYSNWTFTFTPSYGVPKEGENEMTSRISCLAYPNNYTKFSSINITGAPQELILQQQQEAQLQQQQMIERAKANAAKINQTAMFVTIESHKPGQHVPPDSNLTISGTSSDNVTTDCDVSVVLNSKTPYQRALPMNDSDSVDYSNWTFTFTPSYGVPKEGENEMTSRISCLAYPNNYTKFSSINITGAPQELILQQQQEAQLQQQQMIERAKANAAKINQTAMFVTIESHKPGQHVPTDSSLTISGTSSDNVTTDCDVSVVLNSKTPYQRALPMNSSDSVDYSNWTFTFTPSYGVPKEGENEMTSRISCLAYPNNYTKFSSINITGVPQNSSSLQVQQSTLQQPQLQQSGLTQQHITQQSQRYMVPTSNFVAKSVGR